MVDYQQGTSPEKDQKYTYADYLKWPDDERWELINGIAYNMSPAPKTQHQRISLFLSVELGIYLKNKTCEVFAAPFDVKLDNTTVVQPDLLVICDDDKLDEKGCNGGPFAIAS